MTDDRLGKLCLFLSGAWLVVVTWLIVEICRHV